MGIYNKDGNERAEELSDLIIQNYKSIFQRNYDALTIKERWAERESYGYCIMLEKYIAGESSLAGELQKSFASILDKNIESLAMNFERKEKSSKAKLMYSTIGAMSLMVVSFVQLIGPDEEKLQPFQLIAMSLPAIAATFLVLYSCSNYFNYVAFRSKSSDEIFRKGLDAEIIREMPEEEFVKSVNLAKEKLPALAKIAE